MAEVGLVVLARTSLKICKQVLPAHRTKFSKRVFTQPQLLAVLCLMRYEDWTTREAEVRLSEHSELRRALELDEVPDHTTLCKFVARLEEAAIARALELIAAKYPRYRGRATVAVDATGLSPSGLSTYFVRRRHHHQGKALDWKHWLVGLAVVDVSTGMLLAQTAHQGPTNNCAHLRPMVDAAHRVIPVGRVLADAEFDSERNHQHVHQVLGAESIIPAKRGSPHWKIKGIRARMRARFPKAK